MATTVRPARAEAVSVSVSHVSVTGGAVAAAEGSTWSRSLGPGTAPSWSSSWADADANAARLPSTEGGDGEKEAITTCRDSDAVHNQAMLSAGRL